MRITLSLCLVLAALAPATSTRAADALRFGTVEVRSALGQPFDATFTVDAAAPTALAGLSVRLATPETYAKRQLTRADALDDLRFSIAARDGSHARIAITSTKAIGEPTLSLLVEVSADQARTQHEYTVLLDPPGRATKAATGVGAGAAAAPERVGVEWDHELDAYYSDISVAIPLTNEPVPDGGNLSEYEVYRTLFLDSLHPRLLLFEASVYPMPVLGTYIKEHSPNTYDKFDIGGTDVNVLEAVTAGFQEPWAVSAFVGSELNFSRDSGKRAGVGKGYMGYLVSYGAKHIKDNVLIDDDWWEFEWKLKGERERNDEHLVWSFRTGIKNHGNQNIADIFYLGARRSNLDFKGKFLSWLQNSNLEWSAEFTQDHLEFARMDFVIGKKYPFKEQGFALALDFGVVYEKANKYLGPLTDPNGDTYTIVFRPNIEF